MSLTKVLGLVNLQANIKLGEMTDTRPLGVVSFLSRYAILDFALSSFSNSGIDKIGIITPSESQSVLKHIAGGNSWTSNTKTGLLSLMYYEKGILNPKFNTDIKIMNENDWLIKRVNPDYIIVAPSHVVCNVDWEAQLEKHIKSEADVTMLYVKTSELANSYLTSPILTLTRDGQVKKISPNLGKVENGNASLEMFIISRLTFDAILREGEGASPVFGIHEMISHLLDINRIKVASSEYKGYVRNINSLAQYHKVSLELLDHYKRDELFRDDSPIYTTTHNTPPSRYGLHSEVVNSFIANGAVINGHIENSIISRKVTISKGAVIKNCIIFNGVTIGSNVCLENVIVDKGSYIFSKQELKGTSDNPIYIKRGVKI